MNRWDFFGRVAGRLKLGECEALVCIERGLEAGMKRGDSIARCNGARPVIV